MGEQLHSTFGELVPRDRVFVVPNGIPDIGQGEPADLRGAIVLHVSTLWSRKGVFDLLEAVRILHAEHAAVRFVLAGSWWSASEERAADEFRRRFGFDGVVETPGEVVGHAKAELLRSASVFVLPSPNEGQPLVVLEALAAGTPVVSTAVGAIPETIQDGVEGFLVEPGDVAALADRISALLFDRDLRRRMGAAARARYERELTVERFAERLGDVWLAALSSP